MFVVVVVRVFVALAKMSDEEDRKIIRSVFDEPLVTTRRTGRIKNQLVVKH